MHSLCPSVSSWYFWSVVEKNMLQCIYNTYCIIQPVTSVLKQVWCKSRVWGRQSAASLCLQQNLHSLTAAGNSSFWISCCFTCLPCWLTSTVSLPSCLFICSCIIAYCNTPDIFLFHKKKVPPSEFNESCWKLESEQLSLSLSSPLSHALILIPAWLKRTMTALDLMLWS